MININSIEIGNTVMLPIYPRTDANIKEGKVVYIHPEKRFFTLEYEVPSGAKIRESFVPRGEHIACTEAKEKPSSSEKLRAAA